MKTLYFECTMGAAGDMLMASLLELHPNPSEFLTTLNNAGIPHTKTEAHRATKCGITGTHVRVIIDGKEESSDGQHTHHNHSHHKYVHEHSHSHNSDLPFIEHLVSHLNLPAAVKTDIVAVYTLIAQAESKAHNMPVDKVHFHEVGAMDAVADIAGVCLLLHELAPQKILCSPIHVGSGTVRCAHGVLPVPAPATAHILQGIPIYSADIQGELCTPTGAALLKHFASGFCAMPPLCVDKVGYGMGTKDFAAANCVRSFFGETSDHHETIFELSCNLDDMTGEEIGFATEILLENGALDVYTTPIYMKKNRPAVMLSCLCHSDIKDFLSSILFKHTTTLGIRELSVKRKTLERKTVDLKTEWGMVRVKQATGFDTVRQKFEYDDIARIAKEKNLSIREIKERLAKKNDFSIN
ncbi:MAG: nickel pincer cofactor biosynthesis protein LarC [Treponemataceae bacterium]